LSRASNSNRKLPAIAGAAGQLKYFSFAGIVPRPARPLPEDLSIAGQAPFGAAAPNFPVSSHDRVYKGDQFSNTISMVDPSDNKTLGVIQLDGPSPANFSPLYKGQVLVHGMAWDSRRLAATAADSGAAPTPVTLFNQGLVQVLEAAVAGLTPKQPYVLALSAKPDGSGPLQPLTAFMTNPAGAAIVNAIGPIRQIVQTSEPTTKQYLVILPDTPDKLGAPAQLQVAS